MILLMLFYILLFLIYIYLARRSVDRLIPTKARQKKQNEYLKQLRQDRMVGDFVLTAAVLPAMDNTITPEEGFRIYRNYGFYQINGGALVIASISAEKMRAIVLALARRIGSVLSMSFEDYHSDEKNVIDYLSYDREVYFVENIIDRYWRLLQNSYDVQTAIFSAVAAL